MSKTPLGTPAKRKRKAGWIMRGAADRARGKPGRTAMKARDLVVTRPALHPNVLR